MKRRPPRVILASASPRRIELLRRWSLSFEVLPSHVDEETSLRRPSSIVRELALRKARAVARDVAGQRRDGIIIGADTIVVLGGHIIGKPRDERDAARILARLNGTYHKVYTGVAVIDASSGKTAVGYEVSRVKMRTLSAPEVRRLSAKHLDKAGAYAVQEKSDAFVEKIEGDYFNVVGLPHGLLRELAAPFGVRIPKSAGRDHA